MRAILVAIKFIRFFSQTVYKNYSSFLSVNIILILLHVYVLCLYFVLYIFLKNEARSHCGIICYSCGLSTLSISL